jgi:hypothetical protein
MRFGFGMDIPLHSQQHAALQAETVEPQLRGPDQETSEEHTGKDRNRIAEPRDAEFDALAGVVKKLKSVVVRFGCLPITTLRAVPR